MSFSLIPRGVYPAVTHISPKALAEKGVRLVLADLDNTLVPYRVKVPNARLVAWRDELAAHGVALFLLSNSRKPGRAQRFAEALGIPYEGHAGKPRVGGFRRAMARMGVGPEETAIVGDQIFTDTWGGGNARILTLLVDPIEFGTLFRRARYLVEGPFRSRAARGEKF